MQVESLRDTCFLEKGRVYHAILNSWGCYDIIIDGIVRIFPTTWFEKITRKEQKQLQDVVNMMYFVEKQVLELLMQRQK